MVSDKGKTVLYIMLIILINCIVFLCVLFSNVKTDIARLIETEVKATRIIVSAIDEQNTKYYKQRIKSIAKRFANLEQGAALKALKRRDRDALLISAIPPFNILQEENPDLSTFSFILPDNTNFLRVHKPGIFGDNIGQMRPDIVSSNLELHQNAGYIVARTGLRYSVVQPLFLQDQHVGSLQISIREDQLINTVKEKLHLPVAVVLPVHKSQFVTRPVLPRFKIGPYGIFSHDMALFKKAGSRIDWRLAEQQIQLGEKSYIIVKVRDLLDSQDQLQGYLVVALDISAPLSRMYFQVASIVSLSAILLLISFIILNSRYGVLNRIITSKTIEAVAEKERLDVLLRSIGDAVIATDLEGKIVLINRVAIKLTGRTLLESQGKPLADVLQIVNARTGEPVPNPVDKVLKTGQIVGLANHTLLIAKDGTQYQIADSAAPIADSAGVVSGVVMVFRDVTDEYSKREQIVESEKKLRNILNSSLDAILLIDLKGKVIDCNPASARLSGYSTIEEKIGTNCLDQIIPQDRKRIAENIQTAISEGYITNLECSLIRKDGVEIQVETSMGVISDINGNVRSLVVVFKDITERKRIEAAIVNERDFVAAILYWVKSIIVVIDLDGYVVRFNKAAESCCGYAFEELSWKPFWEVLVPREKRESVKGMIKSVGKKKLPSENINHWVTKSGQKRLIHWVNSELTGDDGSTEYILCTGLDLTEYNQLKGALQKSEDKYQAVLENMQEGYFENDLTGRFTVANKAISETMGYSQSELIGMENRDIMSKKSVRKVFKLYNEIYKTGLPKNSMLYEVICKDGEKRTVEVSTSLRYDSNGKPDGFFGVSRDVTERIRMEQMMIQTEKMVSLGGLVAGMAHELNNPLGAMIQGIQNVQRWLSSDLKSNYPFSQEAGIDLQKLRTYIKIRGITTHLNGIRESGKRVTQITSNMLQFSRKSESKMAPTSLEELMEKALDLAGKDYNLKKSYDFRNIKIIKDFDSNLPMVPCTKTEIEQVILNLLSNAAWAMANDKDDRPPHITLRIHVVEDMAQIEVEDNGPGIDNETAKHVFDPFFTTKPVGEGTGLGLAVSYTIISNNHKGTIEVTSDPGKGTKFILRLPLKGI